ncbi:MAG: hypothetical protein KC427_04500 [Sulfurovum sp.]|uniref:hypothetical protein n=1 Tax=Sulfurovum sp. TaxID=1969726 RepID=UPI002867E43E|nr:hypothetical protein [Sulfurovum sp.]MCO4845260.1 hypothetical protein [Sulfurovum sp.]
MLVDFILLFLFAGVPYYVFFEKTKILGKEKIFILSVLLVIVGMVVSYKFPQETTMPIIIVAFLASLFSLYKANKTSNLYKLTYYILFFNAPLLIMFKTKESILYGVSLLITLLGVYLIGRYYERSYGSANYKSVSGITLVTPYAGLILTIYFTALALYPPFPNALLFLNGIFNSDINVMWYLIVVVIFFGNFLIAMRVMAKTVFGKPNDNVHYIDVAPKERWVHLAIFTLLMVLSIVGLQEVLS